MRLYSLLVLTAVVALTAVPRAALAQAETIPAPAEYFGFEIGADGELARYPDVLNYLQLLGERSGRVAYEPRGTTTDGNPYALLKFSARANLDRLDRLVAINHRLADPRGLSEQEARSLAREGVPFYFLYATIHSTEVGNGLAILNIAHRLATEESPEIREILDNTVVLPRPVAEPGRPGAGGRPLVRDAGHRLRPRLPRPVPPLHRSRRQPRLVHVHAEGDAARHRHPPRVQAADHARHAPDGESRRADVRPAVPRPARPEHPPDPAGGAGADRTRDAVGADRGRQAGDHLRRPVRPLDARPPVHGLSRTAAHPDRDRQRQPRRPLRQSRRGEPPPRTAGGPDELPGALRLGRLANRRHRRVRGDRDVRGAREHGEVPHEVARELLPRASRLGEPRRGTLRVHHPGRTA